MTRNSILNRSFSTREKVLILILVVILLVAAYYFVVVKNVADTVVANATKLTEIQSETDMQATLAAERTRMEAELADLGERQPLPEVAVYDNLRNELDELNALMATQQTYDLKFSQPALTDTLVRRAVTVSFTATDYAAALNVVRSLENGSYRCEITDFTMTGKMLADGSIESVTASLNVTYFETINGSANMSGLVASGS